MYICGIYERHIYLTFQSKAHETACGFSDSPATKPVRGHNTQRQRLSGDKCAVAFRLPVYTVAIPQTTVFSTPLSDPHLSKSPLSLRFPSLHTIFLVHILSRNSHNLAYCPLRFWWFQFPVAAERFIMPV
jgi:hypothetical protein